MERPSALLLAIVFTLGLWFMVGREMLAGARAFATWRSGHSARTALRAGAAALEPPALALPVQLETQQFVHGLLGPWSAQALSRGKLPVRGRRAR